MGALIHSKGTRRLVHFFKNQRFGPGAATPVNLNWFRAQAGIVSDFAYPRSARWLFDISEKYIGSSGLYAGTNGQDLFYPSATAPTTSAGAGNNFLNFAQALGTWIQVGMEIWDATNPTAIPRGTTVGVISGNRLQVTFNPNTNLTRNSLAAGDNIVFSEAGHANLIRRWRFYLQTELLPSNHDNITEAISQCLTDTSFDHIRFDVVEDTKQVAHCATEYDVSAVGGVLTTKLKSIILLTARTTESGPLDAQF